MEKVDLNTYKKQMIRDITGYNPDGSNKLVVMGSWGLDVIDRIRYILRKDYKSDYKSMIELYKDIEKLKSDVLAYSLFD